MQNEIEFWFEFGSNYSYLSVMRIEAAAAKAGVRIRWKPFLLGPIFRALGWDNSPFVLQKQKGDYVWRDMERQCRKYGFAWTRPAAFPRAAVLPARVAMLGAEQPWMGAFCRGVMQLNFVEDTDINTPQAIAPLLLALGLDAGATIAPAQSDAGKRLLREQVAEAQARGVFGAPTFFVRDEMFWGNDRLDDALAFAGGRT